jgi:hypothetical protein
VLVAEGFLGAQARPAAPELANSGMLGGQALMNVGMAHDLIQHDLIERGLTELV